jgi:hypothetical protein
MDDEEAKLFLNKYKKCAHDLENLRVFFQYINAISNPHTGNENYTKCVIAFGAVVNKIM